MAEAPQVAVSLMQWNDSWGKFEGYIQHSKPIDRAVTRAIFLIFYADFLWPLRSQSNQTAKQSDPAHRLHIFM